MSQDEIEFEFDIELGPSSDEIAARERIIASLARIEDELGISIDAEAEIPTRFSHWEPDISLLLKLWRRERTDLAIEHVLLSPDMAKAFGSSERRTARNRLETVTRMHDMRAALDAGRHVRSDYTLPKAIIAVCGDQLIWVDLRYSLPDASCSRTSEIEKALVDSPYLQYSRLQHQHLLFCTACQATAHLTSCVFNEVSAALFASMRAQLGALERCLDISEERVLRLAEMQVGVRQVNTDDFTTRAQDLLAWRAIELAAFLELDGGAFLPDQSELNPWVRLLKGEGHPKAVGFVKDLDRKLLEALFVNLITSQVIMSEWLWFDKVLEGPFCVPTDGDLSAYDWAVELRKTANLDEWARTLSDPPHGVYLPATLQLLRSAARLELDRITRPSVASPSKDNVQLDRIEGLIENNNALQMPVIELLDKLVDISSRPTAARAEESLRNYLGSQIFDALVPDARQSLIGAEYIFMDREIPDPPTVLRGIALAFEIQIKEGVFDPLERKIEKLRVKVGSTHPNSPRPGQPIPRKTQEENASKLLRLSALWKALTVS